MLVAEETGKEGTTRGNTMDPKGEDRMDLLEFVEKSGVIFMAIKDAMMLEEGDSNWEIKRGDIILVICWNYLGGKQLVGKVIDCF